MHTYVRGLIETKMKFIHKHYNAGDSCDQAPPPANPNYLPYAHNSYDDSGVIFGRDVHYSCKDNLRLESSYEEYTVASFCFDDGVNGSYTTDNVNFTWPECLDERDILCPLPTINDSTVEVLKIYDECV